MHVSAPARARSLWHARPGPPPELADHAVAEGQALRAAGGALRGALARARALQWLAQAQADLGAAL